MRNPLPPVPTNLLDIEVAGDLRRGAPTARLVTAPAADAEGPEGMLSLREQLDAVERSLIQRTMTASGGNQSEAARRLGLNRGSLIERLKKYGMIAS